MKAKTFLLLPILVLLSYISFLLSFNTIVIVKDNNLLPLWDQAAHSVEGWEIYFYLRNMNFPMFIWKLWTRGLWPFVNNLYLERVAEFYWRSSKPPFLLVASVSFLYAGSVPSASANPLLGQLHEIPHELVQIEREDRPRPCHLQGVPKTLLRFVELVSLAFQRPNASLGPTPLAANLVPDFLGN